MRDQSSGLMGMCEGVVMCEKLWSGTKRLAMEFRPWVGLENMYVRVGVGDLPSRRLLRLLEHYSNGRLQGRIIGSAPAGLGFRQEERRELRLSMSRLPRERSVET